MILPQPSSLATTSRRGFLATSLAAAGGVMAAKAPEFVGDIDAHVHVWTPDTEKYPLAPGYTKKKDMVPPSFTPPELFAHTYPNGVARVVLVQMSFYQYDNRYMLDMVARYPGVFSAIGILNHDAPDAKATLKSLVKRGVRGLRLYTNKADAEAWLNSPTMQALWTQAADQGVAMCLLANPDALPAIALMARKFPKTRVVIDHFARVGMKGPVQEGDLENLCRLAELPHMHVKTSAFYALGAKKPPYTDLAPMIKRLHGAYGAKRLMWASDCPYQVAKGQSYKDSIELVRKKLDFLSADDRMWMLKGTAAKLFF
ncbi:MAG TPA: amidohydrolase family protein [Verrucomicrobium sp.]|nr:amidohydrolase family protein [Verrucomicrobium sp.]